jgi:hypothetical protein
MLGLLVRRTWPAAPPAVATAPLIDAPPAEEWLAVYHQHRKIGYTHQALLPDANGFAFKEESLLRLTLMDQPQTVRTRMTGHAGADFALRDVEFELSSGVGRLTARATVEPGVLHIIMHTGSDVSEQTVPLHEPVYLSSTLRASLSGEQMQAGRTIEAAVFDPTTLTHDRVRVHIDAEEAVPETQPPQRAWRVQEEFHGLKTTAWIDTAGTVLREEGPMDMVLIRQTAAQTLHAEWTTDTAMDIVASTAVPVAVPIENARDRTTLRLRLTGISLEKIPRDAEQSLDGALLTIHRLDLAQTGSYLLPARQTEHAADLAATPFLQSDHPRIQALARSVLGDERDAQRAARRLNDWVYAYLRKVPTVSVPNALQVLDMGEGDCNEHAVLLAALSRAAGLPARVVAGAVYMNGAFLYHAWCEVWLDRWVSIDPALHQFPADATHIKFVVGEPEDQWMMMEIVGRLGIEVLDTADDAHG